MSDKDREPHGTSDTSDETHDDAAVESVDGIDTTNDDGQPVDNPSG